MTTSEPTDSPKKWDKLPTFDELPAFQEHPGCAWSVWGEGDELGTVNLLTEDVVQAASKEVKTGQTVCLNWPLNFPDKPLFTRKSSFIELMKRIPTSNSNDDEITMNTQASSQWDGLRHFGVTGHGVFYQNTPTALIKAGKIPNADPMNITHEDIKLGVQNWAQHGICGRAVFLDLVRYFSNNKGSLSYDPWTSHSLTVADLEACAQAQGVKFQKADILLLRIGFTKRYYESSQDEKDELSITGRTFAGIEQSEDMKRFLWNNHFAAIATDAPTLERWPPVEGKEHMHLTMIGLWGMPIGELFDLEKLSEACAANGRYSFFFTSWPLNILGGCASPPNAAAYF